MDQESVTTEPEPWVSAMPASALPAVLQQHGSIKAVAELACWRARELAGGPEGAERLRELAASGSCAAIVQAMRLHVDDRHVQEDGCGALWLFAMDPGCRADVLRAAGAAAIAEAMEAHPQETELHDAAIGALAALAVADAESEGAVVSSGCVRAVAASMRAFPHRAALQRAACSFIYFLSAGSDAGRAAVVGARCFEAVCAAMRAHVVVRDLQEEGCGALCSLCVAVCATTTGGGANGGAGDVAAGVQALVESRALEVVRLAPPHSCVPLG